jgi:hypothetical protein
MLLLPPALNLSQCPYSMVIPTMKNGMEITMMFGNLFQTVGKEVEARAASGSAQDGGKSRSKTKKHRQAKYKSQQ